MNVLKIQQDLVKALIKGESVKYSEDFTETNVFVTMNGQVGYVLRKADLIVSLAGAQTCMDLNLEAVVGPRCKLTGTDEYRRSGTARRFVYKDEATGEVWGEDVYIDTGLIKYFDHPTFYKNPKYANDFCVVTEDIYGTGEQIVVGCVAPVIIKETQYE